jgi:hypothetical protein
MPPELIALIDKPVLLIAILFVGAMIGITDVFLPSVLHLCLGENSFECSAPSFQARGVQP